MLAVGDDKLPLDAVIGAEADQLGFVPALAHLLQLLGGAHVSPRVRYELKHLAPLSRESPRKVEDRLIVQVHGTAGEEHAPDLLVDPGALEPFLTQLETFYLLIKQNQSLST